MNKFALMLVLFFVAIQLVSLSGCAKENAAGRETVSFIPSSFLTSQSISIFASEKQKTPISQDPRLTAITQRVANRLIAQAQQHYGKYCRGFQWEVVLFDKPKTQNAYCMPGGKIGIYSGILPVCKTEAALAAVIGHEMAHALLNHGAERVSQQIGTAVLLLGTDKVMKNKDVDSSKRKKIMVALGLGAQFGLVLPYSRQHEHEADKMGVQLMALAGYSPSEAPNLWRRMQGGGGAKLPEFFSTHPSSAKRVRRLEQLQEEVTPLYSQAANKYGLGEAL